MKETSILQFAEHARSIYEPEQFAGAILKISRPHKASILMFASGKAVITGLKSSEEIGPTIGMLENIMREQLARIA